MTSKELEAMGSRFASNNQREGITGLLLYDTQQFLQVLEGPPQAVLKLLDNIKKDTRHKDLNVLIESSIDKRNFPGWAMKVSNITRNQGGNSLLLIDPSSQPSAYMSLIYRLLSNDMMQQFKEIETEPNLIAQNIEFNHFKNITDREKQVLALVVNGYTAAKAGKILHLSGKTVARHIENIKIKLNCSNKSDLIIKVFSTGYISDLIRNYPTSYLTKKSGNNK